MYTPSQMRLLRIAVIVMGVILLLGFATVIGRLVYLLNAAPKTALPAAGATRHVSAPLPVPTAIALPKGAVVRHIAISESRLAIHFDAPSGAGIRIVDLAAPGQSTTLLIVEAPVP